VVSRAVGDVHPTKRSSPNNPKNKRGLNSILINVNASRVKPVVLHIRVFGHIGIITVGTGVGLAEAVLVLASIEGRSFGELIKPIR
jgi:hypothetical protein